MELGTGDGDSSVALVAVVLDVGSGWKTMLVGISIVVLSSVVTGGMGRSASFVEGVSFVVEGVSSVDGSGSGEGDDSGWEDDGVGTGVSEDVGIGLPLPLCQDDEGKTPDGTVGVGKPEESPEDDAGGGVCELSGEDSGGEYDGAELDGVELGSGNIGGMGIEIGPVGSDAVGKRSGRSTRGGGELSEVGGSVTDGEGGGGGWLVGTDSGGGDAVSAGGELESSSPGNNGGIEMSTDGRIPGNNPPPSVDVGSVGSGSVGTGSGSVGPGDGGEVSSGGGGD